MPSAAAAVVTPAVVANRAAAAAATDQAGLEGCVHGELQSKEGQGLGGNQGRLTAGPHRLASLCRAKLRVPAAGAKIRAAEPKACCWSPARRLTPCCTTGDPNSEHPDLDLYATNCWMPSSPTSSACRRGRANHRPTSGKRRRRGRLPPAARGRTGLPYRRRWHPGRLKCWTAWSCRPPSPGRASGRWRCWRAGRRDV